jgi:hypothetical protein
MNPTRTSAPSCIVFPPDASHFNFKPGIILDMTKRLMSSPKCRSVEVINNPARPGSNHREINCINYKQQ